ncbi:MAG: DUF6489 family protein, partial [Rhodospirillaceae bacterium]|nr:DUF6489 family protein [Rhodospirillaceae bacterium]
DCTPEEARAFMGLPDVAPLQARMLAEIEARMRAALEAMDPQQIMASWMAEAAGAMPGMGAAGTGAGGAAEAMAAWQKSFFDQFAGGGAGGRKEPGKK